LLVYINQKMRKLFEGLYVHDNGLNRVKDLLSKKQKVVLIPVYKSFVDLPVLLYCLYLNKIDFPFSFGNVDDIPNVAFLEKIITNCGYIKATRSRGQGL
jgi:glycerol-3-phosphate O-acyltransferase